jgi:hypothetical protein
VDRSDLELVHNKIERKSDYLHKHFIWPRIHGRYMEKYRYRNTPLVVLAGGYLVYPAGSTIAGLVDGHDITPGELIRNFRYHLLVWHSFMVSRLRRVSRKGRIKP